MHYNIYTVSDNSNMDQISHDIPIPSELCSLLSVWYKTKFGSQNLATNFGNHL